MDEEYNNNHEENIYAKIQEILANFPANYSILEEEIDIDTQMEYFEFSRIHKDSISKENILASKEKLFDPKISIYEKKLILCHLATTDDVSAFRCIEKYLENPQPELKNWAILALQESKMTLESFLLDENRIFISTGLGGKGNKLRYFVVLIYNEDVKKHESQKKIIKNEFEFAFSKYNSEIEEIIYMEKYVSLKVLIPIDVTIDDAISSAITEINQYGNFINPKYIITNLKKLTEQEINDFLKDNPLEKIS